MQTSGYALADALIALLVVTVGTLGLLQLQGRLMNNSIESNFRIRAAMMTNELMSMASIDADDAPCFTVPVADQAGCNNAMAQTFTQAWENEVNATFPGQGIVKGSAILDGNNRLSITIQWQRTANSALRNHNTIGQVGL